MSPESKKGRITFIYNHLMPFDSLENPDHLYFLTASIINWHHLFSNDRYAGVILDTFTFYRNKKELLIFAFVIMPSHFHAIIKPLQISIGNFLQSYGSFTAHKIIKMLKEERRSNDLEIFHKHRRDLRSNYSVWQEIFTENIFSEKFLEQKLEYIHQNPTIKDANSIEDRADFIYSSAGFYDYGEKPIIEIDDIRDYLTS